MGNSICPIDDVSQLASVARDICPFPNYSIAPLFINMLSVNSSVHLRDHYTVVQSSLTPKQLEDFTQSLRSTFGREGKVTLGGMGVVALSLAVLFDTFAKQVRGELVLDSGPIPGLFVKNPRGYYPPQVHTLSEFLRLLPHIANNPRRMRKETERCLKRLKFEDRSLEKVNQNDMFPKKDASTKLNYFMTKVLAYQLKDHYHLINGTKNVDVTSSVNPFPHVTFNFNCDPDTGDQEFLSEVQQSDNQTQEAFKKHIQDQRQALFFQTAKAEFQFSFIQLTMCVRNAAPEDFDLKFNSLGKWAD